jgi:arylformamidase
MGPRTALLDLTLPVATGMPVFPGDPEVALSPALKAAVHGVNVLRVHMGSQSGTHVDAPYHVDDRWPRLDTLPLERFTGPAVALDLRDLPPRAAIPAERLEPVRHLLGPGVVLLLVTGWSAHWGGPAQAAHPWLTVEAARAVVDAGVRTVGVDAQSVDPSWPAHPAEPADGDRAEDAQAVALPAHRVLCGAGCVIAENLTGLDRVVEAQNAGRAVEVSLFPLALAGADGAPVRAVARLG